MRVGWFEVVGVASFPNKATTLSGLWLPATNSIVFGELSTDSAMIVRHEMLHALLQRGDHPAEYFQRRCLGVVSCHSLCVTDTLAVF